MYLTSYRIRGLWSADEHIADGLERVLDCGPDGWVVATALDLFASALDKARLPGTVRRLGWASSPVEVVEEEGLPVQVALSHPHAVRPFLWGGGERRITVSLTLALDPPLYGELRAHALKDPRLVPALAQGASLTIRVGWLFTRDLSVASLVVHEVGIGDVTFTMTERPAWLIPLLQDLGTRFFRVDWRDPGDRATLALHEALLSADPEKRKAANTAAEVLKGPPFDLGRVELVRVGDEVEARFGPGLLTIAQLGPAAAEALRLVDAVYLRAPDVLVVEAPGGSFPDPASVRAWLSSRMEGDEATVEQVVFVPGARS